MNDFIYKLDLNLETCCFVRPRLLLKRFTASFEKKIELKKIFPIPFFPGHAGPLRGVRADDRDHWGQHSVPHPGVDRLHDGERLHDTGQGLLRAPSHIRQRFHLRQERIQRAHQAQRYSHTEIVSVKITDKISPW